VLPEFAIERQILQGRKTLAFEICQFDIGKSRKIAESRSILILWRQYVNGIAFFYKLFNKVKPEFVDTPTGVGNEGNTDFSRHTGIKTELEFGKRTLFGMIIPFFNGYEQGMKPYLYVIHVNEPKGL